MKSQKNVRLAAGALIGVVLLAAVGWVAAKQIKSPAQIASETAAPRASLISVPVEQRELATEVIVRGTVRYGKPQPVALPPSLLKTGAQIVSRVPYPDAVIKERQTVMTVSGRPVFVLQGDIPMHRDLGPSDRGEDVKQLEEALKRAKFDPGKIDGRYDKSTAAAVAQFYRSRGYEPFGLTDTQIDKLNAAASALGAATDFNLQTRVTLRTAQRGPLPQDINQARLDANAVSELLSPARAAIAAARTRLADAKALSVTARRSQSQGDATARRDLAAAGVDLTTKRNLLNDAIHARDEAQIVVDSLPPDAPPAEVALANATLQTTSARVPNAERDVAASEQSYKAAENIVKNSRAVAGDSGRQALRNQRLAQSDLEQAMRTVQSLERKQKLALNKVRILTTPLNIKLENEIVEHSNKSVQRTRDELERLASQAGVQVPSDEILFFPTTPVRVDTVVAKRGGAATGDLLTVSNTRLAIDSSLSQQEKNLIKPGMDVRIEEQDLRIEIKGKVEYVAPKPGFAPVGVPLDFGPGRTYFEVTPFDAPPALRNASVRLTVSVQSTEGKVLTVPVGALSIGADGRSRVQVDLGNNKTRVVYVTPGLSAQGQVQVTPKAGSSLKSGDLVVVGSGASAAGKAPTTSTVPIAPAGVNTVPQDPNALAPGGSTASGATGATTTPSTAAPSTATPSTPTPSTATPSTGAGATTPPPPPPPAAAATPGSTSGR